jgi:stearoyl-CoA desaturase (delta-9 desaturase)
VQWHYAVPLVALHLFALAAAIPYFFSWTGVIVMAVGVHVYGDLGINLCYHRLLSHRSLKVPKWFERVLVFIGLGCLEDSPATWVSVHRFHHGQPDTDRDPHSPLVAFLWSHVGWLIVPNTHLRNTAFLQKYARDVLEDPFYMRLEKNRWMQIWVYLLQALAYVAVGYAIGGTHLALSLLVWGVFVRTVVVWHLSWFVNSLTHLFGYRNYETPENSRNNALVAVLTSGEGWHNNHHADPRSASNQHRWWEIDLTYYTILLFERLGLATDVVRPRRRDEPAASPNEAE